MFGGGGLPNGVPFVEGQVECEPVPEPGPFGVKEVEMLFPFLPVVPDFRRMECHLFEFVTADRDTVTFNASVAGDVILGSHLLFEERDRGDIVLGRVKPGVPPR